MVPSSTNNSTAMPAVTSSTISWIWKGVQDLIAKNLVNMDEAGRGLQTRWARRDVPVRYVELIQEFSPGYIILSYVIAVVGSLCTLELLLRRSVDFTKHSRAMTELDNPDLNMSPCFPPPCSLFVQDLKPRDIQRPPPSSRWDLLRFRIDLLHALYREQFSCPPPSSGERTRLPLFDAGLCGRLDRTELGC